MNMMDLKRLNRLPYVTKRIYILEKICQSKNIDLEYLFGLFSIFKRKNSGRWFWQKAVFTGVLKTDYDNFNIVLNCCIFIPVSLTFLICQATVAGKTIRIS